jgi:eukaryotic-like serine/threonine-protein kinase
MSASESPKGKELYEFGPFRVDPEKQVLQRDGEFVPLQPKTFQILLVLIRHNQELVTKDDLMKAVWPDTFVEEANLSRNIFMLRKALGENAPEQRYIITVPGQGYRLAENVRFLPAQQLSVVAAKHEKVEIQLAEARTWRRIAVAAIVVIAVAAATWRLFRHRAVLTEKDTVVLADFANSTGDSVFDGTLRQGMTVQLEQSPFLSLISDQRIRHTLGLMGRSPDSPLTPEVARQICERTGSAAVLEGSITSMGNQYVLGLRAKSCRSGDILDEEQAQAPRQEDVLSALSQIAKKFRTRVGESLATIQQHNTPLAEATTPSLEALEAYSEALRVHVSGGAAASLPLFKRAAEIDPRFAMAHAALGRVYADLDESDLSAESTSRAWQLRFGTSDREKFFITAAYETLITGNEEQAQQTFEAWARTYPREALPHSFLGGYAHKAAGRYEKAAAESERAIELDPDLSMGYYNLGANNAYLDRLDEAENALRRAAARGLEIDEFIMLDYDIAFLKGDQAGMEKVAARARQRSGGENWISAREGLALAYSGHLQQARVASRRAVDHAQQAGQRERAGLWEAGTAIREAWFGIAPEAKRRATAALALSKDRETEYGAALALALSVDSSGAQRLADDLEQRFPEDTAVRFSYLPVLRAQLALNGGDGAKAIDFLQAATPYELGAPRSAVHALYGALYPIYLRGEAYLAERRGVEAAAELQKILNHRGIVVSDPIGALAHLQLARALALSGDKPKAQAAYQDFLTLWKSADPNIPILKQAKAEYAKLQ